jgi:hypothetical protein
VEAANCRVGREMVRLLCRSCPAKTWVYQASQRPPPTHALTTGILSTARDPDLLHRRITFAVVAGSSAVSSGDTRAPQITYKIPLEETIPDNRGAVVAQTVDSESK